MIASPLHLFDCCLATDAGDAVVLTSMERARDLRKQPIAVLGTREAHTHSFTITVLLTLESLGFCAKGEGGAFVSGQRTAPSPPVVEMLGYLGFDWILLDNERGSITVDSAENCIAAAELSGMAPIVRPVGIKPELITPFLDRGAWGCSISTVR